jgi:hypothetical protein
MPIGQSLIRVMALGLSIVASATCFVEMEVNMVLNVSFECVVTLAVLRVPVGRPNQRKWQG